MIIIMGRWGYKQGLQGAEFRSLGPSASIRLEIKNSWHTSRGCKVNSSNHAKAARKQQEASRSLWEITATIQKPSGNDSKHLYLSRK